MGNRKDIDNRRTGYLFAGIAFLASFCFFLIAYPFHLIRREQMNLFVFDWDYISGRFSGIGWLSSLLGSFADQFFGIRALGPLIISLLLVAIGAVTYRICRHFLGKRLSLLIAALLFVWTFLRECNILYMTRYTIAVLGFLCLGLLALQFKKTRDKALAAVVLLCFGGWALGVPYNSNSGKLLGVPSMKYERLLAMNTELANENWDRVLELSEKDLHTLDASLCYNLAQAMKGQLGNKLFDHSQSPDPSLFMPSISGDHNIFTDCLIGEIWYQLGDFTIAEQSAITSLQASPEHTGARFIERLARINIITGQKITSQKYLNLLKKTVFYRKWAVRMLNGTFTEEDAAWIERGRSIRTHSDFVPLADITRSILLDLLEVNPDNTPAREYLLCSDLIRYDLENFFKHYDPCRLDARLYKEAVVLWLGRDGYIPQESAEEYDLNNELKQRFDRFYRYPNNYRNTYWYYYLRESKESEELAE